MKIIGYPTHTPPDRDSLRRCSKQLLSLATEALEMAIEKDEKTTPKWLDKKKFKVKKPYGTEKEV